MRLIFLNPSPFPLGRSISSSENVGVLLPLPGSSGTTAVVGVEHAGGAACGVVQSSTVHLRHWLNFPSHYENWHLLSCLFPWQQCQELPAELIGLEHLSPIADAKRRGGVCFPPCQASVTELYVFAPLHSRTVVLRCSAKCREMRTIRYYKGEEEDVSKEDGRFICLAFFPCEQKREMGNIWFYYVYLNWFCILIWAEPHVSSLCVLVLQ